MPSIINFPSLYSIDWTILCSIISRPNKSNNSLRFFCVCLSRINSHFSTCRYKSHTTAVRLSLYFNSSGSAIFSKLMFLKLKKSCSDKFSKAFKSSFVDISLFWSVSKLLITELSFSMVFFSKSKNYLLISIDSR